MRGQAHIVFRDVQASTQAMRALQGFDFFGKEMVSDRELVLQQYAVILMLKCRESSTVRASLMQLRN